MRVPTETNYEPCGWCSESRAEKNYERAIRCRFCRGTGIVSKGDTVCNRCGGSMYPPKETMNSQVAHGLHEVKLTGGYESDGLLDLHRYTFSLCETCIRHIFMECRIPPRVERVSAGMLGWEPVSFGDDQEVWEYMEWKRSGGHATARLHRICNATKACGQPAIFSVTYSEGHVSDDCLCEAHKGHYKNCINATIIPFVPYQLNH